MVPGDGTVPVGKLYEALSPQRRKVDPLLRDIAVKSLLKTMLLAFTYVVEINAVFLIPVLLYIH